MLSRALVEGFRGQTWYDSPSTTLGVLEENPKSNPQACPKAESWPNFGDLRNGSMPGRSIHVPRMASVGQTPPNHAAAPDHGPTARSVNGLTFRGSRALTMPVQPGLDTAWARVFW